MDKTADGKPSTSIVSIEPALPIQQYQPLAPTEPWKTGFWRRFPWSGALALVISVAASAVMIAVLCFSEGQPISDWTVSPSVYLSISSTIANTFVAFALQEGMTVAWWNKSMKPGTRVSDLHNIWAHGTSLRSALLSGRSFNAVAWATVVVTLAKVNGPLLQRASIVTTETTSTPVLFVIPIAQELPAGYTGILSGHGYNVSFPTPNASAVFNDYNNKQTMNLSANHGCDGQCLGTIQSAGLNIDCTVSTSSYNLTPQIIPEGPNGGSLDIIPSTIFSTTFSFLRDETWLYEGSMLPLNLSTAIKSTGGCQGNLQQRTCTLVPAIMESHIIINNNSLSLDPDFTHKNDEMIQTLPLDSYQDLTWVGPKSTYGGLGLFLSNSFNSKAQGDFSGAASEEIEITGMPVIQYAKTAFDPNDQNCSVAWSDPTEDMLAAARELAFRLAFRAANPSNITNQQTFRGTQTNSITIYRSQYAYLGVAIALTLLSTLSVAPMFLGWWKLGRDVTISPIETAKAFDPKILQSADSNSTITKLMREIGSNRIRYGVIENDGNDEELREKLAFDEPGLVSSPQEGALFVGSSGFTTNGQATPRKLQ